MALKATVWVFSPRHALFLYLPLTSAACRELGQPLNGFLKSSVTLGALFNIHTASKYGNHDTSLKTLCRMWRGRLLMQCQGPLIVVFGDELTKKDQPALPCHLRSFVTARCVLLARSSRAFLPPLRISDAQQPPSQLCSSFSAECRSFHTSRR